MSDTPARSRSGSSKRQRSARPAMRCNAAELAILNTNAERAGLTVGAFMRKQCLGEAGPRAVRRPPAERAALGAILAQLGKTGSNLNQIARAVNQGRDEPLTIGAADTARAIAAYERACDAIMELLGKGRAP